MKTLLLAGACALSIVTGAQAQSMTPIVSCNLGYRSYTVTPSVCEELTKVYITVTDAINHGDERQSSLITQCITQMFHRFPLVGTGFYSDFCTKSWFDIYNHNHHYGEIIR
jgi:hypothetical protein